MKTITQRRKSSQRFTKFFIGGLLFPVPRAFWMGIKQSFFPLPILYNLFLQKALVAAANQHGQPLHLIDNQDEEHLSPLDFTQKHALVRVQSHQAKHYLKQALLELGFKRVAQLPPLSLIVSQKSPEAVTLKKIWEKELGIQCSIVSFPPKKGDQTLHLAFAEWNASIIKDPLLLLDTFKRETDKLKLKGFWQHPGYQSLFKETKKETHLNKKKSNINSLEEMMIQELFILPLFYGGMTLNAR